MNIRELFQEIVGFLSNVQFFFHLRAQHESYHHHILRYYIFYYSSRLEMLISSILVLDM